MSATAAIILGAGSGVRAGQTVNKMYVELDGLPVIVRAARPFVRHPDIEPVVVVAAQPEIDNCRRAFSSAGVEVDAVIAGGETRHASETRALDYLAPEIERGQIELVLVHDGARPIFHPESLGELLARARYSGGAIYGVPLTDELMHLDGEAAHSLPSRGPFWCAQTPQAFRAQLLLDAYRAAAEEGFEGTDTAASVERIGGTIGIVRGDPRNVKITYPEDLRLAEWLIKGAGGP